MYVFHSCVNAKCILLSSSLRFDTFSRFGGTPAACAGQTDRQTDTHTALAKAWFHVKIKLF